MDILERCAPYQADKIKTILEVCQSNHSEATLLVGDSLFNRYPMDLLKGIGEILNFGIDGATTQTLFLILQDIIKSNPRHIVLLVGTNDFNDEHEFDLLDVTFALFNFILRINTELPQCKVSVISPLPIDEKRQKTRARSNRLLKNLGNEYKNFENELSRVTYIDVFDSFLDDQQQLKEEYTTDGLHLSEKGYFYLNQLIKNHLILL